VHLCASHHDIAIALYGPERVEADCDDLGENPRDRVRRAVKRSRNLMNDVYLELLRLRPAKGRLFRERKLRDWGLWSEFCALHCPTIEIPPHRAVS
jgi:hypothetical protein